MNTTVSAATISFTFEGESQRLDKAIQEYLYEGEHELTRSVIKGLIEKGAVEVDGVFQYKAGTVVKMGAVITLCIPERLREDSIVPQNRALEIIFEDDSMLVLNKPAGLTVHPGAGQVDNTLVNALAHYLPGLQDLPRCGLVHRLDKDTSGVIVVGKTRVAQHRLTESFLKREVKKEYTALVLSTPRHERDIPKAENGTIDLPITRDPKDRRKMTVGVNGRASKTHWSIAERMNNAVLLNLQIETGRTHQIRVHCSHLKSPVIGDRVYGDFSCLPPSLKIVHEGAKRHALHSTKITIPHPDSGELLSWEAPIPDDMMEIVHAFRRF